MKEALFETLQSYRTGTQQRKELEVYGANVDGPNAPTCTTSWLNNTDDTSGRRQICAAESDAEDKSREESL